MFVLSAGKRRLVYVTSFETLAILLSTLLMSLLGHGTGGSSVLVAAAISTIAVIWNFVFNTGFEAMERRLNRTDRSLGIRVLHSLGFEGGLVLFTVPLLMIWFNIGLIEALQLEAALLLFFLVFTFVYTWIFDQIFALPGQTRSNA